MRTVQRRHTTPEPPWCTCKMERPMGYRQHPDHPEEYFVHGKCLKPARRYWAVQQGRIVAGSTA